MPIQAITLASLLMSAQPSDTGAPRIEKIAAPCHIEVEGKCKVERSPQATAGKGGDGGNATVNYNFYFDGPKGGNGAAGGSVKLPPERAWEDALGAGSDIRH